MLHWFSILNRGYPENKVSLLFLEILRGFVGFRIIYIVFQCGKKFENDLFMCLPSVVEQGAYGGLAQLMDIYGTMKIIVSPIYTKNATSGGALRRI